MKHTGNANLPFWMVDLLMEHTVREADQPYVQCPTWRCKVCGATWLKYRQDHPSTSCSVSHALSRT